MKIFILSIILSFTTTSQAKGLKQSFFESVKSPRFWAPSAAALALVLSKYDGKLTSYASRNRPIFGSVQNARSYSDAVTFYYFPAITLSTHAVALYTGEMQSGRSKFVQYSSALYPSVLTYGLNSALKNRTGRIRPDDSNNQSFPSSHTALASSFSETTYLNSKYILNENYAIAGLVLNELLVTSVAWARMEAKRHHLSDVLVGYSIGKFFSSLIHSLVFDEKSDVFLSLSSITPGEYSSRIVWNF